MRLRTLVVAMALGMVAFTPAQAEVSVGISMPGLSIGINLPVYPNFVRVPGYPVYYAPQLEANYFFYDGLYWVYARDNWYASLWYNGPWDRVDYHRVPLYMLRVPVQYYRMPPPYFRSWRADAPPHWGDHWGGDWQRQHSGWDQWNRSSAPAPAPLPTYQRQYSGKTYPAASQQRTLHQQRYSYTPHEEVVRQQWYQKPGAKVEKQGSKEAPARQAAPPQQQQQPHNTPEASRQQGNAQPSAHQGQPAPTQTAKPDDKAKGKGNQKEEGQKGSPPGK
ncbi:MAG: hypothetical protein IT483_12810 [Gammaproteobacteria bacterium]|jgi:hypothetical protein|nr:hypothetical protein [Gammaproteobacteria bacterium]